MGANVASDDQSADKAVAALILEFLVFFIANVGECVDDDSCKASTWQRI